MYSKIVCVQDDPNWWQARLAECPGAAQLIPSLELEERRKAYVDKEADYANKYVLSLNQCCSSCPLS